MCAIQYATIPGSEGIWLRGFDKLKLLNPGETRTATFQLRRKDLSLWDTEEQLWYIPDADIQLQVGASSTKLYLVRCLMPSCVGPHSRLGVRPRHGPKASEGVMDFEV